MRRARSNKRSMKITCTWDTGMRSSPGLHGASQPGTRELSLEPSQDLARKVMACAAPNGYQIFQNNFTSNRLDELAAAFHWIIFNIDVIVYISHKKSNIGFMVRVLFAQLAGLVRWTRSTWKKLSLVIAVIPILHCRIPVSWDGPGWAVCHVMVKFIFDAGLRKNAPMHARDNRQLKHWYLFIL